MTNPLSCFHCAEPVPRGSDYHLDIHQQRQFFCCPACLAISQTIHAAGLDDYYQQRQNTPPPAQLQDFSLWDNAQLQSEFVQRLGHDTPASEAGERLEADLYLEGMHCTACAWLIEKHLSKLEGLKHAHVHYQEQKLTLQWYENSLALSEIMQQINAIGYIPHPYQQDVINEAQKLESKKQLTRIGISALLMMQIGMLALGLYAAEFVGMQDEYRHLLHLASLAFSLPVLYFSALPFFTSAYLSLRQKSINMDVNISLAIMGLYGSSIYSIYTRAGDIYFDSVIMLCLFILIARYIELRSRQKLQLQQGSLPKSATKLLPVAQNSKDALLPTQQQLPLNDIAIDDVILIKAGETIALDGVIIDGSSSVSEAFISGEQAAITKQMGDTVFAGSQNHDGTLEVRVTVAATECLVNKIATLSRQQGLEKPAIENRISHFSSLFTALVLLLAVFTYLFWLSIDASNAFWVALSVLVISCPCALSLAAPTALSAIQYRLRQQGLLIRSSSVLEPIEQVSDVIFDKTGTLTDGLLSICKHHQLSDTPMQRCLTLASSLESYSQHPVQHAFNAPLLHSEHVKTVTSAGIEGFIEGQKYRIGSPDFCQQWHSQASPPESDKLLIGLCDERSMLAWFELEDSLRPAAIDLINALQQQGKTCHILSGDSSRNVPLTAEKLGISHYQQACSSEDKLRYLEQLQQQGAITLMIGDGINDAPVLSKSHLSVVFSHSSDWIQNNADIILLNNDLENIQRLIDYTHAFRRIYLQNFSWALVYNAVAIPFAVCGWVTPMVAALGMSFSSIVVVLNSQRLLRLPEHKRHHLFLKASRQTPEVAEKN